MKYSQYLRLKHSFRSKSQFLTSKSSAYMGGAAALYAITLATGLVAAPQANAALAIEEVVVTARRREEVAQDVAVSMSLFSQKQLDDANITNPGDLALYTPSLQANNRFGGDNTTFAIRGFSQELRTTASVGVYFAEVIAPRGANAQQSGDGAPPGDLFDLASVQVLKGPSGTLFGRNTTGGAVLLVPKKPTEEFEGYVEYSQGNYDMQQEQAVVNFPVSDSFKLRLGIDHKERDGYQDNFSGIGPDNLGDVKYTAYRLSAVWDITDSVENYTIVKHMESENNGYTGKLLGCKTGAFLAVFCKQDQARREAGGNTGFYDVYNSLPEPVNEQTLSQAINTTTWAINDDLTLKNIISYATLETKQKTSLFGENWEAGSTGFPIIFQQVGLADDLPTTDQDTWVEEIQLQGFSFDHRLTWQAGLYYEKSEPGGDSGAQSPAIIACDQDSITSANPNDFRCNNLFGGFGKIDRIEGGVEYVNQAIYAQGTWEFNDKFSTTLGLRYTKDETSGQVTETIYDFPLAPIGSYATVSGAAIEKRHPSVESEEPTWLIGFDYNPTENTLLYAKYTRGYRQGSVNLAGSIIGEDGSAIPVEDDATVKILRFDTHEPETVDTYEIGSKNTFEGPLPGNFNLAAFYNDFQDQQIQFGYFKASGVGTTAITNAGKSTIKGMEADGSLLFPGNILLTASYSYLDTNVDELELPYIPPTLISVVNPEPSLTTAEGEPLSLVPKSQVVATLAWLLPIDPVAGDIKASVTYVYTDEMQAVAKEYSAFAVLPQFELWNINLSWEGIFGSGFDLSAFVSNAKDEEYVTFVAGTYNQGIESGATGSPRMYGARLRYNFGAK